VTIDSWADSALTHLPRTSGEERRRAARRVATAATNATDAAALLAVLGLTAEDGLRPAESHTGPELRESA
jgi:hypothetical protein